jgi:hypothetical protein
MNILICAADPADKALSAFASRSFPSGTAREIVADAVFSRVCRKKAPGAFVYFDAGLGSDRVIELASKLDSLDCRGWGVLDRRGESTDPAAYFFAGACDYVGAALFKSGFGPGRFDDALAFAGVPEGGGETEPIAAGPGGRGSFPGWPALEEGTDIAVRFCYAAIGNQKNLLERIGEKRLDKLREDFAAFLEPWSKECGGIVWIRDNAGCLLLFPPQDEGMNPVLAAFRLLLDRALIGYEVFKLEVPLSFRFAFHAGRTTWQRPGATGKIVSEDVNFAFHLGGKAAGDGYIVSSSDAEKAVPSSLRDLFSAAGDFEGRSLIASRRFKD